MPAQFHTYFDSHESLHLGMNNQVWKLYWNPPINCNESCQMKFGLLLFFIIRPPLSTPCMIIILKSYVKSTPFHDIIANSVHNDFRSFFLIFLPPSSKVSSQKKLLLPEAKNATQTIFVMTKVYFCNSLLLSYKKQKSQKRKHQTKIAKNSIYIGEGAIKFS